MFDSTADTGSGVKFRVFGPSTPSTGEIPAAVACNKDEEEIFVVALAKTSWRLLLYAIAPPLLRPLFHEWDLATVCADTVLSAAEPPDHESTPVGIRLRHLPIAGVLC